MTNQERIAARTSLGISQKEVARRIRTVGQPTISNSETGHVPVDPETLATIDRYYAHALPAKRSYGGLVWSEQKEKFVRPRNRSPIVASTALGVSDDALSPLFPSWVLRLVVGAKWIVLWEFVRFLFVHVSVVIR